MTIWCTYWTNENVLENAGEKLDHIASDQFLDRSISVGDAVYVINWKRGRLRVVGSLQVGEVCDQARAEQVTGGARYRANGHLLARPGTATVAHMNRWLSDADLRAVEFEGATGPVGPKINRRGDVDHQSFRSTREINSRTKKIFDDALQAPARRSTAQP